MDFSKFKNKFIINGQLEVENGLHIGLGHSLGDDDSPFIRTGDRGYYIPGSSFRGYLRTKIERLVNNEFKLKNSETDKEINNIDAKLIFGYTNLGEEEQLEVVDKLGVEFEENTFKQMAGKVHISDMPILTKAKEIKRDGIKISRDTGTTEDGAKFDYNILGQGNIFSFEMILENVEDYQLDLIKIGLQDILNGDIFGGKSSRGIGKCKLSLSKVDYIEITDKKDLEKYLFKNKMNSSKRPLEILDKGKINLVD